MITCGGRPGGALIVPISGIVIAKSASTSSRYASNSSSARSISSINSTGGSGREFSSARSSGRRMRNSSEKMSRVAARFASPRASEARGEAKRAATRDIFSEEFLIRRPLLRALENSRPEPPVLLIDEIDRADEEFEAYLLEVLADFAITIPEIGTIQAPPGRPPHVIITSNRTREVH